MSLMPLSLYRRLQLQNLQPTSLTVQLVDYSTRQPIGILEDVPVQVRRFVIPCNFIIMDMDGDFHTPLILGRPFLATAGVVIDKQASILSFQSCGERVDFCFPPPTPFLVPANPPSLAAPAHHVPPVAISKPKVFDEDGGHCTRLAFLSDPPSPIPINLGITSACTGEVVDSTPYFHTSPSPPPMPLSFTIWRQGSS